MTLTELEDTIKQHMLLADEGIVKLLCAYVVASRLPIRAPWLFVVGASSGGKSMLLESLQQCDLITVLDDLTASTFVSGMAGKDGKSNSLLHNLKPNSILVVKDFTTLLSKNKDEQKAIIGQMRKIYDGDFVKKFGNGQGADWKGKISILAGVTSSVHTKMYQLADMGERFLMYSFHQPGRYEQGMKATENLDTDEKIKAMGAAFREFVEHLPASEPMTPDEETRGKLVHLAEFASRARSAVERNEFSRDKEIKMAHFLEMPGRFAGQLMALACGLMMVNGSRNLEELDKRILYKISLDSIPHLRRQCLQALTEYRVVETSGLAVHLKYPPITIRLALQDLAALQVIDYTKSGNRDKWELHNNYRQLMSEYEGIKMTEGTLEDHGEVPAEPVEVEEIGI